MRELPGTTSIVCLCFSLSRRDRKYPGRFTSVDSVVCLDKKILPPTENVKLHVFDNQRTETFLFCWKDLVDVCRFDVLFPSTFLFRQTGEFENKASYVAPQGDFPVIRRYQAGGLSAEKHRTVKNL